MNTTISKEFWDDQQWGLQHHSDLISQYKDQWIAIVNKKVVSSGDDLGKVEEEAKQKTGKKDIPVFLWNAVLIYISQWQRKIPNRFSRTEMIKKAASIIRLCSTKSSAGSRKQAW